MLRSKTSFAQHASDEFAEPVLTKLDRRYIYRYGHRRETLTLPSPRLKASRPEHPLPNRNNQTAVFRNSYEPVRWHKAKFRVLPAEECFQSGNPSSRNIHLRLIHQKKLFSGERRTQIGRAHV